MKQMQHIAMENPQGRMVRLRIGIASTFLRRLSGLLFRRPLHRNEGLLITHCSSVHMFGMRYGIDVVWLDRSGSILKCTAGLKPWRASACKGAWAALEMAEGTIARLDLRPGKRMPPFGPFVKKGEAVKQAAGVDASSLTGHAVCGAPTRVLRRRRQDGASMTEFIVVAPALLLIGLGIVHYGLLFFAKNNINYAAFEAARAGSVANADIAAVETAYKKALIPLYGGGTTQQELEDAYGRVKDDLTSDTLKVELLNPTKESFDDWNAKGLQDDKEVGNGKRVIPVLMQNFPKALENLQMTRDPKSIGPASGQTLSDASLIKVRIIHGYKPQVPLIGKMLAYLAGYNEQDSFKKGLYDAGRIPLVTHVTLQMQSNAIESTNVSSPGAGNGGHPVNPDPGEGSGSSDSGSSGGGSSTASTPPCTGIFCSKQTTAVCDPAKDPNCGTGDSGTCPGAK